MLSAWRWWKDLTGTVRARERAGLSMSEWRMVPQSLTRWAVEFERIEREVARG